MADDGLIAAYLRELRFSVRALADADDLVLEAEDHLWEAAERLIAAGRDSTDAQSEAVARFGSAELVARIGAVEATRGAAVPTIRTRQAGLAAMLAPVLLAAGQAGNLAIDRGAGHGVAVTMLVAAFPAFVFGLWGLEARHGRLGRIGRGALVLAIASPVLAMAALWGAIYLLAVLLAVAVVAFAVKMLRASVLPVAPVTLFGVGGLGLVLNAIAAVVVTATGGDAGRFPVVIGIAPIVLIGIAFVWLGGHLWQEPAVDRDGPLGEPFVAA